MDERVLLMEDDLGIREIVAHGLTQAGFEVTPEGDGREALSRFNQGSFQMVIIDVMLPSLDGFEVCRQIRTDSQVPIVMLTAKTDTVDVVLGLEAGADDYITKPFEMPELIARVRAALRRTSQQVGHRKIEVADVLIDPASFKSWKRGMPLMLTPMEFRLLLELAKHPGQVLTREMLLDAVWGYEYAGDVRLVNMAIKRLREKVEENPRNPRLIETVRGIGYRLESG
jgi:two-component system, OmpR family, response regulator MtrA